LKNSKKGGTPLWHLCWVDVAQLSSNA